MSEIEEIKERLEHRRESYIFVEYVELVQIADDALDLAQQLRSRLEVAEEALSEALNEASKGTSCYPQNIEEVVWRALQKIRS